MKVMGKVDEKILGRQDGAPTLAVEDYVPIYDREQVVRQGGLYRCEVPTRNPAVAGGHGRHRSQGYGRQTSPAQRLHDHAVQGGCLEPDFGKSMPGFAPRNALPRMETTGGRVAEGSRSVSEDHTQTGIGLPRGSDLPGDVVHQILARGLRLGLVGDQGSAQFQEIEPVHAQQCSTLQYGRQEKRSVFVRLHRLPKSGRNPSPFKKKQYNRVVVEGT